VRTDGLPLRLSVEVVRALQRGVGVVALESAIFSPLGLPETHGAVALRRCVEAVRAGGAVPAVTAVLDGVCRVGLEPHEHERVLSGEVRVAERDLPIAAAQCWPVGVTTVSASLSLASRVGVAVLSTAGIGGVPRDVEHSGAASADLDALATHPMVTVCAGAKAHLDLSRTLQRLETLGVPVLGWGQDDFPALYTGSSGLPVSHRVQGAGEAARVLQFRPREDRGVLLAVPIPGEHALDEQDAAGTDGGSVTADLALAENNARVAAAVAARLAA